MKKRLLCIFFITTSVIFEVANVFAQGFCDKNIEISQVEVLVDNVRESQIEEQIKNIAKREFNSAITAEFPLAINITVRQRSYYKDIDSRNSIYVHYTACDKTGAEIFEDCFCSEGRDSIISAATQTKQMEKAARGIKKFIKRRPVEKETTVIAKR